MIAYFDTSSIIPLIVEERASETCARLWDDSTRVVSARLAYVEARAALAHARRLGQLTPAQLSAATAELDRTIDEVDHVEVTEALVRVAGDLAEAHALRGYAPREDPTMCETFARAERRARCVHLPFRDTTTFSAPVSPARSKTS